MAHGLQKKPVDFGYNPDHVTLGSGLEKGTVSGYGNLLYLSYSLHNYVPGRCLRSSRSNLLCVPSYKLNFGTRSFRVAAPTVWNSLPADIHACTFYSSLIR